jgi:hypothetical protein
MQVRFAEVVQGPPTRNNHRISVTPTQDATLGSIALDDDVQPEHEILGAHSIGDRSRFRTTRSLTQHAHH